MYTVFGYDMMCIEYRMLFDSFVSAVKSFRECEMQGDVVFIKRDNSSSCMFVA